jgi:hypothetical protein
LRDDAAFGFCDNDFDNRGDDKRPEHPHHCK